MRGEGRLDFPAKIEPGDAAEFYLRNDGIGADFSEKCQRFGFFVPGVNFISFLPNGMRQTLDRVPIGVEHRDGPGPEMKLTRILMHCIRWVKRGCFVNHSDKLP